MNDEWTAIEALLLQQGFEATRDEWSLEYSKRTGVLGINLKFYPSAPMWAIIVKDHSPSLTGESRMIASGSGCDLSDAVALTRTVLNVIERGQPNTRRAAHRALLKIASADTGVRP